MMQKVLAADILSPVLAYMRLTGEHKMILESIPRESENIRFSIVAHNPVQEIKFQDGQFLVDGKVSSRDPLEYLAELTVKGKEQGDLLFQSGAIGYVAYDFLSLYENIGYIPTDTIGTPDLHFFLYESYLLFDYKKEKIYVVEENTYSGRSEAETAASLDRTLGQLKQIAAEEFSDRAIQSFHFQPHLGRADFEEMVRKAKILFVKEICFNAS